MATESTPQAKASTTTLSYTSVCSGECAKHYCEQVFTNLPPITARGNATKAAFHGTQTTHIFGVTFTSPSPVDIAGESHSTNGCESQKSVTPTRHYSVETLVVTEAPDVELLGFVLPDRYDALIVQAPTLASETKDKPGALRRCHSELLVATMRCGCSFGQLNFNGNFRKITDPVGWLTDTCLRSVAKPTPPSQHSPLELAEAIWLDRIMTTILSSEDRRELTWTEIAGLCPIPAGLGSNCVESLAYALAESCVDWHQARQSCISGESRFQVVTSKVAAWMDTNMFARWAMSYFVDPQELRDDLALLAPAWIANQVTETITFAKDLYALQAKQTKNCGLLTKDNAA